MHGPLRLASTCQDLEHSSFSIYSQRQKSHDISSGTVIIVTTPRARGFRFSRSPSSADHPYDNLTETLIKRTTDTEQHQLQQLLTLEHIGRRNFGFAEPYRASL
ncbi:hypothetical protein HPB52_007811 [Rhipicephalus sanguineus]|uniref:Uncharacterized protein n=1 Tax=Rhipicephalus sanguineus TaxID=34632 RepID=A0A9D4PIX6_RHISA|nr:hypothetical protein HPB52_007811 [Rhipicephalus sanguineus]